MADKVTDNDIHSTVPLSDKLSDTSEQQTHQKPATTPDRSLRSGGKQDGGKEVEGVTSRGTTATKGDKKEDSQSRQKAFTAVAVLVVAIVLLLCLYKFSTITEEGKSQ